MEKEKINVLLAKYNEGIASTEEVSMIENLLEKGLISLEDLHVIEQLEHQLFALPTPDPSRMLDQNFYATLAKEKRAASRLSFSWFSFESFLPKLAFGVVTFLLGLAAGFLILQRPTSEEGNLQALTQEVTTLKEMMMLSMLERESATERLKAVNLSGEMERASQSVTNALIKTLNQDDNVNVRLAALDALKPYIRDSMVRAELIKSIANQDSPLVQIALADLMAAIQEKRSVKEFEKLLENERTPGEIKDRIRDKIQVLI